MGSLRPLLAATDSEMSPLSLGASLDDVTRNRVYLFGGSGLKDIENKKN